MRYVRSCLRTSPYALLFCIQVNKKDKAEPKMLTITPSENTHFRVILSSEAMEEDSMEGQRSADPVCSIVKPEPRTIKPDQCPSETKPPEAPPHNPDVTKDKPDLSNPLCSSFTPEPCPSNTEQNTKPVHKTRWTSSPPSRRDSGSAASGSTNMAGDAAAVCADAGASSKATDSPIKRRSNMISFTRHSDNCAL